MVEGAGHLSGLLCEGANPMREEPSDSNLLNALLIPSPRALGLQCMNLRVGMGDINHLHSGNRKPQNRNYKWPKRENIHLHCIKEMQIIIRIVEVRNNEAGSFLFSWGIMPLMGEQFSS